MLRSLLALLAVLVTGLAFLFDRPWLYVVTGLIVIGGLGTLGWWLWTTYKSEERDRPRPTPEPDDSDPALEDLGIVDIKPEGATVDTETDASSPTPHSGSGESPNHERGRPVPSSSEESPAPTNEPSGAPSGDESTEEAPVLGPLLESLRAAIDARTVCLLVQEDVALTYRIEALASTHASVQSSGTFDTQTPLLTATMSRESVTLRSLAEEKIAIEDLRYYDDPPPVDHLAAAPVSRPDTSSTTFLLADAPAGRDLDASEARTLLDHFSDTVALLLSTRQSSSSPSEPGTSEEQVNGQHPGSDAPPENVESSATDDSSPRPRHEIIAEEMEAAQAADGDLALALVHLNRAESIARRGDEAVASAERLFQDRLEQLVPNQRIERFGELTYGIFFREGPDAVEPQVADLETTMAREDGELEGGVSVGVALWGGRNHNPKALRAEATEALREAYETGTPTIVA